MKITELDVTVFAWDDIPAARYGNANPVTTSRGEIGLLRIATDEGLEGHAFLGFAASILMSHPSYDI